MLSTSLKTVCLILCALLCFFSAGAQAHKESPFGNKSFYFSWGYSRAWYSASDIYLKGTMDEKPYELKISKAKAKDRPDFDKLFPNITIPQFNARLAYVFKKHRRWAVELNYDHAKYVVRDYQTVRVDGYYGNTVYNGDMVLRPDSFLHFEHTNGANFWMLNLVHAASLAAGKKAALALTARLGAGVVIPKSDVTLFGKRLDNYFHVAGTIAGAEIGLRASLGSRFYLEPSVKYAFCNYSNVLTVDGGKAHHRFRAAEAILVAGFSF